MPVTTAAEAPAKLPSGLSPKTLELWLAAARYRRVADALAEADKHRPQL